MQRLTGGQFTIEATECAIVLVHLGTGERETILNAVATPVDYVDKAQLSQREREVFEFIAEGFSTRDMAVRMELSEKTVETYRARIKQKLDIHDAHQLMRLAIEWKLRNSSDRGIDEPAVGCDELPGTS